MTTMNENDEIKLYPIAAWKIGPVLSHGIVTFRPDFLTHPFQGLDEANAGRHYALTPEQARALIQDLSAALEKLETAGFQPNQGRGH